MAGHYFNTVENVVTGKPVAGATITVYNAGATIENNAVTSGTLATIYSDDGVTVVSGSAITSNARGFFEFWTNDNSVVYEISYGGSAKFAVSDVDIIGGSVSGDVTSLQNRVSNLETITGNLGTISTQDADDVAITGGAISGITDLAVADGGTGASSASAARTNLGVYSTGEVDGLIAGRASTSQTTEMIAGFIASPADKDYRIVVKMAHGGTITETTTRSASGTCTATFKVNTTALGGTANSVSTSEQSQAHASTNTFVAGDDIVITVSSNAASADMSFAIQYTRTLA